MFKIDLTHFSKEIVLDLFRSDDGDWGSILASYMYDGGAGACAVIITINGIVVVNDSKKHLRLHAHLLHNTLKSLNNAFYKLINGSAAEDVILDLGSSAFEQLLLKASENNVLFSTTKYGFPSDNSIHNEPVDFSEACSEVIRLIRWYKDIWRSAEKDILKTHPTFLLQYLFGPEWLPLEESFKKYTRN